jgi:hypothetical protein
LRLDRRLSGRVDASAVPQEAYQEVHKRFTEWVGDQLLPFFLCLRLLTGKNLTELHRHHLGAQMRDAGQEVSLCRRALPQASPASLAAYLLGKMTPVSQAAIRAEHKLIVQGALNKMDVLDREVSWSCAISSTCAMRRPPWYWESRNRRRVSGTSGP